MENRIKTHPHTDKHCSHCQRIEKCGQHRSDDRKKKSERLFRADVEQDLSEYEQQQILHEVNTGHHEHQQKNDLKICLGLVKDTVWLGQTQQNALYGKKAPGLKRIASQRERKRKDELGDERPTRHHGPGDSQ